MVRSHLVPLTLAAVVSACSAPATPDPRLVAQPSQETTEAPMPAPAAAAHEKAVAEVKRLTEAANRDPLLAPWTGPEGGAPPFDRVKPSAFPAAFETAIALRGAELEAIALDPAPPTFDNTVAAYQDAGRHLERVVAIFDVYTNNLKGPEVQAINDEWAPKLAAADDQQIYFDPRLFARVDAVHAGRAAAGLEGEKARLVELLHDEMVRKGSRLDAAGKERLGKINEELAGLFATFGNKVLADEETWIVLETKADLAGLPADLVATYKAAAEERKLAGKWAVVNTRSSVDPFLTSSRRRDLRQKVWTAFKSRGEGPEGTAPTIARIVALRAERAKLLGYPTHAHLRMADTMAKDPAKASALMMRVWPGAAARVKEEVADMMPYARKERVTTLEPWDYLYYAEKVKAAKYRFDGDKLKPYFVLDNMIKASMYMAERLYGLSFVEITGKVPAFHPDVRVWQVKDKSSGADVGLFYGDYFARPGKRSGAWMQPYRLHETFTGQKLLPVVSNNNNFVRGAAGAPILISLDDTETLFHEFGHAIHYLLSNVAYPDLGETPSDFVEYPSQVHEMWVLTKPILDGYARHYKTGARMPQALVDKVNAARTFNQGYVTVEYLLSAILDMELHASPPAKLDVAAFERDTLARIGAPREVAARHRLPQFNHLFASDDYSAGYYSYLWSEVMDADTRAAFAETGDVFDPGVAAKLREHILAPGNATDRAEAYRAFRGRDPDVRALLVKRGFPTGE